MVSTAFVKSPLSAPTTAYRIHDHLDNSNSAQPSQCAHNLEVRRFKQLLPPSGKRFRFFGDLC